MNNISLCTAQAVAAREGLEEQLQGMQARLAGSPAGLPAGLLAHSPAAVMDSPFARHSCVLHEMQSACAELKTQNASLRAELAELRGAASRQGVSPGACASPGVVSVTADWDVMSSPQCRPVERVQSSFEEGRIISAVQIGSPLIHRPLMMGLPELESRCRSVTLCMLPRFQSWIQVLTRQC